MKQPLMAIVGPTAVGKSAVAIEVADRLDAEIISADSMQIYQEMNIGTAKLPPEKRISARGKRISHHLVDIIQPNQSFSVADFQCLAGRTAENIYARHHLPLVVGGTGLYLQALVDQQKFEFQPPEGNGELRARLRQSAQESGNESLYRELLRIDPSTAEMLHPNDLKRVIRALEVYHLTGKPLSQYSREKHKSSPYNLLMIGLTMEREQLYRRINERVDLMIKAGLVQEVEKLLGQGMSQEYTAFQAIGYKEIIGFLQGKSDLEEAIQTLKRNTRRYAKRQLTWFHADPRIQWLLVESGNSAVIVDQICHMFAGQLEKRSNSNLK